MFFAPVVRTRAFSPAFRSFDRSFERFIDDHFYAPQRPAQVSQDDKGWTITLDVPGLSKDALSIGIEGAVVRIESKPDAPRQVRAAWELPQEIDVAASQAKLENGVLTLTLARVQPVSNVVQLAIN